VIWNLNYYFVLLNNFKIFLLLCVILGCLYFAVMSSANLIKFKLSLDFWFLICIERVYIRLFNYGGNVYITCDYLSNYFLSYKLIKVLQLRCHPEEQRTQGQMVIDVILNNSNYNASYPSVQFK